MEGIARGRADHPRHRERQRPPGPRRGAEPRPGEPRRDPHLLRHQKGQGHPAPGNDDQPLPGRGPGGLHAEPVESTELSFFPTPGKGCPDESKIGTVRGGDAAAGGDGRGRRLHRPAGRPAHQRPGAENPFDSLLALYIVIKNPDGASWSSCPVRSNRARRPGGSVATFDDLPQLPFRASTSSSERGRRAPLVTPPTCGTYTTDHRDHRLVGPREPPIVSRVELPDRPRHRRAALPAGRRAALQPGLQRRLDQQQRRLLLPLQHADHPQRRRTGHDQVLGRSCRRECSASWPGSPNAPTSAIAAGQGQRAAARSMASPSCPANSQIGRILVGAGVGSVLTYVPGKVYLGGPFNGAPLSVVAITPAVAGPFDVGTVVGQGGADARTRRPQKSKSTARHQTRSPTSSKASR